MIHTGPVKGPRLATARWLLAGLVVGGAACSADDGRQLPAPTAEQLTTTTTSDPPTMDGSGGGGLLEPALTSPDFADGGAIPAEHSCEGPSPALSWTGLPEAAELAVVVLDIDAQDFVHWIVTGVDPVIVGLGQGSAPEGAVEHGNDHGTVGWWGPCPPPGPLHRYVFTVYALAQPLVVDPATPPRDAAALIDTTAFASASLTGTFAAG